MSKLEEITSAIADHQTALQKQVKEFETKLQGMFKEIVTEFFNEAPEVGLVTWTQYTPYFNDGEECTFSVNDIYFVGNDSIKTIIEEDEQDIEDMSAYDFDGYEMNFWADESTLERYKRYIVEGTDREYWQSRYDEAVKAMSIDAGARNAVQALIDLINSNEDVMRSMFGDHVTVQLTREKIESYSYDHE